MAINASKTANSNINLQLLRRHLKNKLQPGPHVRPENLIEQTLKLNPTHAKVECQPDVPIVIKSYKLIGNSDKTKFVCPLIVGVQVTDLGNQSKSN